MNCIGLREHRSPYVQDLVEAEHRLIPWAYDISRQHVLYRCPNCGRQDLRPATREKKRSRSTST